jgi:hypothetical protein
MGTFFVGALEPNKRLIVFGEYAVTKAAGGM